MKNEKYGFILQMLADSRYQLLPDVDKVIVIVDAMIQAGWQAPAPGIDKWREWLATYTKWHKQYNGLAPRTSPGDMKALKSIATYLIEVNNGNQEQALIGFNSLLTNWNRLTPFLQKQIGLTSINKNLVEVIEQIRTHGQRSDHEDARNIAGELRNRGRR
jgi:hypothetical protein